MAHGISGILYKIQIRNAKSMFNRRSPVWRSGDCCIFERNSEPE